MEYLPATSLLLLKNSLLVATPDILREEKLKELEEIAQRRIELRLVTPSDFNFAFHCYYEAEEEMKRPRLGRLLVEEELITTEELQKALKYQRKSGKRLGEALVELDILKEEELEETLSRQLSLNFIDPDPQSIDVAIVAEVPEEVARGTCSIPLLLIGDNLLVATHSPDEALKKELARISGRKVRFVLASREKIIRTIDHCYTQWRQKRADAEKLGGDLVNRGLISPAQLEDGLAIQERSKEKLGKILVDEGFISSEQLMEALSDRWGISYVKIDVERIDRGLTKGFYSRNYLLKNCLIPLYVEGNELLIAMEDPLDVKALDEVRWSSMKSVLPVMATRDDIYGAINYIFEG